MSPPAGSYLSPPGPITTSRGAQTDAAGLGVASFLALPRDVAGAGCADLNPAQFLGNGATVCSRKFVELADDCVAGGVYDADGYAAGLVPNGDAQLGSQRAAGFEVTVVEVDGTTLAADWKPAASSLVPPVTYDAAANVCNNAVRAVRHVPGLEIMGK